MIQRKNKCHSFKKQLIITKKDVFLPSIRKIISHKDWRLNVFVCSVHESKDGILRAETLHDMICVKDRVKEIN